MSRLPIRLTVNVNCLWCHGTGINHQIVYVDRVPATVLCSCVKGEEVNDEDEEAGLEEKDECP